MDIRLETIHDHNETNNLVTDAFKQPGEAALVKTLRDERNVISLVAESQGVLLGHALFTPVTHEDDKGNIRTAVALGPIAVDPDHQGGGIGSVLIREGIQRCKQAGWPAVFVLGDPAYYGRFGWRPAKQWNLNCQWHGTADAFQAMELVQGGLTGWRGLVRYHAAFDDLG